MTGVSTSFITDLTKGKDNPSSRIMERIADALDNPLLELLKETDLDSKSLEALAGGKLRRKAGLWARAINTAAFHQAFVARQ